MKQHSKEVIERWATMKLKAALVKGLTKAVKEHNSRCVGIINFDLQKSTE